MAECDHFACERIVLQGRIGLLGNVEDMVSAMLESEEKWHSVVGFVEKVMRMKEEKERIRARMRQGARSN